MNELVLVKWGGSLITDKRRRATLRPRVLSRLAGELARGLSLSRGRPAVVLGHGSGSFGHVEAARAGLAGGIRRAAQRPGVGRTQRAARELHRAVVGAMLRHGLSPFSLAPASFIVSADGRPRRVFADPFPWLLERGLIPVVFGDVVSDVERGVSICSTESIFRALVPRLRRHHRLSRILWLGNTDGVLDGSGRTIPRIGPADRGRVLRHLGVADGVDVTGGMVHRVESALALARAGVESLILDGGRAGVLEQALKGRDAGGTRVVAR